MIWMKKSLPPSKFVFSYGLEKPVKYGWWELILGQFNGDD